MRNLAMFKEKVREYYGRLASITGRRYTQANLAEALLLDPADLSHKLKGDERGSLTTHEVKRIVKVLAEWQAIQTQGEAIELLDLMECPLFSAAEWMAQPLNRLRVDNLAATGTDGSASHSVPPRAIRNVIKPPTVRSLYRHTSPIGQICLSPDNRFLIITDTTNTLYLITIEEEER